MSSDSFSCICTRTRFEQEAQGNSEMSIVFVNTNTRKISLKIHTLMFIIEYTFHRRTLLFIDATCYLDNVVCSNVTEIGLKLGLP